VIGVERVRRIALLQARGRRAWRPSRATNVAAFIHREGSLGASGSSARHLGDRRRVGDPRRSAIVERNDGKPPPPRAVLRQQEQDLRAAVV